MKLTLAGCLATSVLTSSVAAQVHLARVSVASGGAQSTGNVDGPSLSADGRFVAFGSGAPDLVAGDTNNLFDVFVHDRLTSTTERVSVSTNGFEGNGASTHASISADGRYVAFTSRASNLDVNDLNSGEDVFVHDRQTGTTTLLSRNALQLSGAGASFSPAISGDGQWIVFFSSANDLDLQDANPNRDAFFVERATGQISIASLTTAGGPGDWHTGSSSNVPGGTGISHDGRVAVFLSEAALDPIDQNGLGDVYVRDRVAGTTRLVSVDQLGNASFPGSSQPAISGNGRFVVFYSSDPDLVPGDTNNRSDVFVRDLALGTMVRASVDSFGSQVTYVGPLLAQLVGSPSISFDGSLVAFETSFQRLVPGDTGNHPDVFVYDTRTRTTQLLSRATTGAPGIVGSVRPAISADGSSVAFQSDAHDLVVGDTNAWPDVFVAVTPNAIVPFCFGDGSAGACPCGTSGGARSGCPNSSFAEGTQLVGSGRASVSDDTLTLSLRRAPVSTVAGYFQSATAIPASVFGAGLRCAGGPLVRLGNRNVPNGTGAFGHTIAGDPDVSAAGAVPPGALRHYQVILRDTAPLCTTATYNLSNALSVVWAP